MEIKKKIEEIFQQSRATKKLTNIALKNQALKKEYARIKKRLEEGTWPMDIGKKLQ